MSKHPTERFSDRVRYYLKYRPRYPAEIIPFLNQATGFSPQAVVADIGSGTGFLTEPFLQNGNPVWAVEPNQEMRQAAETLLESYPNFKSINGQAEATTLATNQVDFILAGQAFHWFNFEPTKHEFNRILKPGGWILLVWNDRQLAGTPFLEDYEALLHQYAPDYGQVNHKNIDPNKEIADFFAPYPYHLQTFPNIQQLNLGGITGRLLSSSYAPLPGHPNHEPLMAGLQQAFENHQHEGQIDLIYETKVYYGQAGE